MRPKNFEEANVEIAKDQPEYQPLPAFVNNTPEGEVISCWELSFKERLRVLFKGEIWLMVMSFNRPLNPVYLTTNKEEVISTNA